MIFTVTMGHSVISNGKNSDCSHEHDFKSLIIKYELNFLWLRNCSKSWR